MKKKFLAFLLSLTMLLGFAPGIPVLAVDDLEGDTGSGEEVGSGDLEGDLDDEDDGTDYCYLMIQLIDADTGESIFVKNNSIGVFIDESLVRSETEESGVALFKVPMGETISIPANFVDGYCLVGYTTEIEPVMGTILDEDHATYTLTEGETVIYALFEKSEDVTVTFHWSSADETPLASDITVTVPTGIDLETAIKMANVPFYKEDGEYVIFEKEGYKEFALLKNPITSYKSYLEIWNTEGDRNTYWYGDLIRGNTDVYVGMVQPISEVIIETSLPYVYAAASDAPVITLPANANYVVEDAGWYGVETEELTSKTFEADKQYKACVYISAKPGYYFVDEKDLGLTTTPGDGVFQYAGETSVNVHILCDSEFPQAYECIAGNNQKITQGATASAVFRFDYSGVAAGTTGEHGLYARATGAVVDRNLGVAPEPNPISICDELRRKMDQLTWEIPDSATEARPATASLQRDESTQIAVVGELSEGSVIINLYPEYIDTLIPGEYTLTVFFDDGSSVSSTFTVVAAAAATATPTPTPTAVPAADANKAGTSVPSTGEGISNTIFWGAVLVCIAVIGTCVVLDKKRLGKKDVK